MSYTIFMGMISRLRFDFELERYAIDNKWKWFYVRHVHNLNSYIEYAPKNKGNLYKVRKYFNHFEVWYGTKRAAYCSHLYSVISFLKDK
jgi:hypothetical protein